MSATKICKCCGIDKPVSDMTPRKKNGRTYFTNHCKKCESLRTQGWQKGNPEKYQALQESTKLLHKHIRVHQRDRAILFDSRHTDKKSGLINDLDRKFIQGEILKGCYYCGDTQIQMTLDRIDNTVGHLKTNVMPCCIRCNVTRRNMPYEAWLVVAKGMREARQRGLFGNWAGSSTKANPEELTFDTSGVDPT